MPNNGFRPASRRDAKPSSADQSATNIIDHICPYPCTMLVEEFGARIPKLNAAAARPSPIAIRMQHDPGFVAKRAGQVHYHGVHADDEI